MTDEKDIDLESMTDVELAKHLHTPICESTRAAAIALFKSRCVCVCVCVCIRSFATFLCRPLSSFAKAFRISFFPSTS